MAVMIRLKRFGRTNRPFWRICATDKRFARDGRVLEELGHYDPLAPNTEMIKIHRDRVVHWLKQGARPSDTCGQLLAHLGLSERGDEIPPVPWRKKRPTKAKKKAAPASEAPKAAPVAEAPKAAPVAEAPKAEPKEGEAK